jgi:hypothetical protein
MMYPVGLGEMAAEFLVLRNGSTERERNASGTARAEVRQLRKTKEGLN